VHVSAPREFTRQEDPDVQRFCYPGDVNGKHWDKRRLRSHLQPVRAYQEEHDVRILLGEFGATRYSDGARKYLEDVIRIAERREWDWLYRSFRADDARDVERGAEGDAPRLLTTKTERMIRSYLARNLRRDAA
jgi:hypothetical protein